MDTGPYIPGGGMWAWCPVEHRTTNLFDAEGKRIGFQIERSLNLQPGVDAPHNRWVSVTKDGEWLRNDYSTFHATWEEAEKAVERRIRRSVARYEGLAKKRSPAAVGVPATAGPISTSHIVINTRAVPRTQRPRGTQGCLIVIAIAAGTLIAAIRSIAQGL